MDITDVLTFSLAQRHAMHALRKEYQGLSRNSIDLLLYIYARSSVTVNDVATNFLYTNSSQAKATINQLIKHSLVFSLGYGIKGKPRIYFLTENGKGLILRYKNNIILRC